MAIANFLGSPQPSRTKSFCNVHFSCSGAHDRNGIFVNQDTFLLGKDLERRRNPYGNNFL